MKTLYCVILLFISCSTLKQEVVQHKCESNRLARLSSYLVSDGNNAYRFIHESLVLPQDWETTLNTDMQSQMFPDLFHSTQAKYNLYLLMLDSLVKGSYEKIHYQEIIDCFGENSLGGYFQNSKHSSLMYRVRTERDLDCEIGSGNCSTIRFNLDQEGYLRDFKDTSFDPDTIYY